MPKCWNKGGCIYNSNNSPRYKKCRREDYSRLQCKIDYMRKYKAKLEAAEEIANDNGHAN